MRLYLKLTEYQVKLLFFIVTNVKICNGQHARETIEFRHIKPGGVHIFNSMSDILLAILNQVDGLEKIRQCNLNTASYEVGFLTHIIQNKYRKMIDKYYSAVQIGPEPMFLFELIILLEEIEHGYFQMEHIVRMLSQVERKYEINTPLIAKAVDLTLDEEIKEAVNKKKKEKSKTGAAEGELPDFNVLKESMLHGLQHLAPQTKLVSRARTQTKRKKFNWKKYYQELEKMETIQDYYRNYKKRNTTRWWWPIEYGWEIDYAWTL